MTRHHHDHPPDYHPSPSMVYLLVLGFTITTWIIIILLTILLLRLLSVL